MFLGSVAKMNSILVMMLRNTNRHFWPVAGDGLKTSSLGDCAKKCQHMTRARNDHKPGVLMDSPASSMGVAILATEAIVVIAHPNEGPKSLSTTREK